MIIKNWLKETEFIAYNTRPRMKLNDGFSMSIQTGYALYCIPRENLPGDMYTHVEVGYPSEPEELLMDYAENPYDPTGTVYGYVPIEIMEQIILKHGGIVNE